MSLKRDFTESIHENEEPHGHRKYSWPATVATLSTRSVNLITSDPDPDDSYIYQVYRTGWQPKHLEASDPSGRQRITLVTTYPKRKMANNFARSYYKLLDCEAYRITADQYGLIHVEATLKERPGEVLKCWVERRANGEKFREEKRVWIVAKREGHVFGVYGSHLRAEEEITKEMQRLEKEGGTSEPCKDLFDVEEYTVVE